MDRRKSLKIIGLGTLSTGVLLSACKTVDKENIQEKQAPEFNLDRAAEELERDKKLRQEKFFTATELATISILCDIIIPADEVSGNATTAGVPGFIEFMVNDKPELRTPLRGGLRWLDVQSMKRFEKYFKDCDEKQRLEIVDDIAFPNKVKPGMQQGVSFFNLIRNLTASGFYTSEIGVKDIGYVGNKPNQWNGVPVEVLNQYGLAYTDKELKECISFNV